MRFMHSKQLLLELASCLSESSEDAKIEIAIKPLDNVGLRVWNDISGPESEPPGLQICQTRSHVLGAYVANLISVLFDCSHIDRDTTKNDAVTKEPPNWKNYPVREYWQSLLDTYLTALLPASHPLICRSIGVYFSIVCLNANNSHVL